MIAETGAGQHGVATATAAALFGLGCTVYMGAVDVERQALNVWRMKLLGADVVPVQSGSATLKDAVNEAMRAWVASVESTHYCLGSAMGPHPFPWMVREFQRVVGDEARPQSRELLDGDDPDFVVACVGGGSNAIGTFAGFLDTDARLVGVEAGGLGLESGHHGAAVERGVPGVVHGMRSLFLQDEFGQVLEASSISAGLDYPGVGPAHAMLAATGRAEYHSATDEEALAGFQLLAATEGIVPALEPAHAHRLAREAGHAIPAGSTVLVTLSGRGDKDAAQVAGDAGRARVNLESHLRAQREGPEVAGPYVTGPGRWCDPLSTPAPTRSRSGSRSPIRSWTAARSRRRASAHSISARRPPASSTRWQGSTCAVPPLVMTYYNLVARLGHERCAQHLRQCGVDGAIVPDLPFDELDGWGDAADAAGVETVLLAAPTTPDDRLAEICGRSHGFVYGVSLMGVTGERDELASQAGEMGRRCKAATDKPVLLWDQRRPRPPVAAGHADGVIVGSALVRRLLDGGGPMRLRRLSGHCARRSIPDPPARRPAPLVRDKRPGQRPLMGSRYLAAKDGASGRDDGKGLDGRARARLAGVFISATMHGSTSRSSSWSSARSSSWCSVTSVRRSPRTRGKRRRTSASTSARR